MDMVFIAAEIMKWNPLLVSYNERNEENVTATFIDREPFWGQSRHKAFACTFP
jgi:hypothetical protein